MRRAFATGRAVEGQAFRHQAFRGARQGERDGPIIPAQMSVDGVRREARGDLDIEAHGHEARDGRESFVIAYGGHIDSRAGA